MNPESARRYRGYIETASRARPVALTMTERMRLSAPSNACSKVERQLRGGWRRRRQRDGEVA